MNDYEYDPAYQEAYKGTLEYQQNRLNAALADTGNEIARGILPHLITSSSMIRALWSEFHADQVARMGRFRLWWHIVTSHRG